MGERIRFQVWSSDGERKYDIEAYATATGVRCSCSCEAGQHDTLCKHRLSLIAGDAAQLASGNAADIKALQALLSASKIPAAVATLRDLESQLEQAQSRVGAQKKAVARYMRG